MSTGALIFMILAWTFVLGLMSWSFAKILRAKDHFDPDGIGPASPPVAGLADPKSGPSRGGAAKRPPSRKGPPRKR